MRTRGELATLGTRLRLPPRPATTAPTPRSRSGQRREVDERILEALGEVGLARLHLGGGAESLRYFKAGAENSETSFRLRKRVLDADAHAALAEGRDETWFPPWYPALRSGLAGREAR